MNFIEAMNFAAAHPIGPDLEADPKAVCRKGGKRYWFYDASLTGSAGLTGHPWGLKCGWLSEGKSSDFFFVPPSLDEINALDWVEATFDD